MNFKPKKKELPNNKKKLNQTRKKIDIIETNPDKPEQRQLIKYYNSVEKNLENEIEILNERLNCLKEQIILSIKKYKNSSTQDIVSQRYEKFRNIGSITTKK